MEEKRKREGVLFPLFFEAFYGEDVFHVILAFSLDICYTFLNNMRSI